LRDHSAVTRELVAAEMLNDAERRREQRAWYMYEWADHGFVTVTAGVLAAPYLISVAETAACGTPGTTAKPCYTNLDILGVPVSPGSLIFYVITISTLVSAFLLPVVGAVADRTTRKRDLLLGFAWLGAAATMCLFLAGGRNWLIGSACILVANIGLGSSLVVYNGILVDIALPEERDRVSARAWAFGYLGGGLLLVVALVIVQGHATFGLSTSIAVRTSMFLSGVWWAGWSIVPWLGLRDRAVDNVVRAPGGVLRSSFGQLRDTLRHVRGYPMTALFLLAYLFYNDGIQTVISTASAYGNKELGLGESVLIEAILLVQFVAFGGALLLARLAVRFSAWRTILGSLVAWTVVVIISFFLPVGQVIPFLVLALLIGLVIGGSQALSRSLFSQLIPPGRAAEYFALYQACERGTSWFGTLVFGLVHQWTGSYRDAIIALVLFFIVGGLLLARVDVPRAVRDANQPAA
jgi:UMF1 family MFS transporter